ncbi:DNA-binding domain-containing protein [Nitrosomonas marina]|uniref:Mu DNA binding, I gamma subdomain n=1 Tax=Nitrosomonas marina TaxID=917 RepID=A0A1H8FVQ8_9PROT|nr:DNA-binding domain-containing protein [Nitrosomonas marina]SEN35833.1 Mu DNA binding, I gamma subdomain [Nitrosomonas marina]
MSNIKKSVKGENLENTGSDADFWLPVSAVSKLTGKHEDSIREACAERSGKYRGGSYIFRKQGKRYEILLTSLPDAAQYNYWLDHHRPAEINFPVAIQDQNISFIDHETLEVIADNYSHKSSGFKEEAQRRVLILDEYLKLVTGGIKKGSALEIIKSRHENISKATLWRWLKIVKNYPRQYWEIALAPEYKGRERKEIPPEAWHFYRHNYGQQSEPDATVIYHETKRQAKAKGWGDLPSLKTFIRRWKSDVPENEKILARKGRKALKEHLPYLKLDYNSLVIHEVWESDGRIADIFCKFPDGKICRPWIVLVREVKCRKTLSVRLYTTINVALVTDAFRAAMIRSGTTPEKTKIDSGTEYSNNAFTGGQKSPYRASIPVTDQPLGMLTLMGIDVVYATPEHGQAKSMERFWDVIARYVDKYFAKAYTGRNPVERPEYCDPRHAIPIEEYLARLLYVIEAYEKGEFGKNRGQGMNGKSPTELYEELMNNHKSRPAPSVHLNIMRPMVFRRTLDRHLTFTLTIPGYGQVQYEIHDNPEVKRGYKYDLWPDAQDPREPALVYEGMRYIGTASFKEFTPVLDNEAGTKINQLRGSLTKEAVAGNKAVEELAKRNDLVPNNATLTVLPELPQAPMLDVLRLPESKALEPEDSIQVSEDGSVTNTQTGNVIKYQERTVFPENSEKNKAEERERKLKEMREKAENERLSKLFRRQPE